MELGGKQLKQLCEALMSAFPEQIDLEKLLRFELDVKLADIATGSSYGDVVFKVIRWAEAYNRVGELVAKAHAANPGNAALKAAAEESQPIDSLQGGAQGSATKEASVLHLGVFLGEAIWVHPLPEGGKVTIGRGLDNDLRLDHPTVSREHAVLSMGSPLQLKRISKTNKIHVSNYRISRLEVTDAHEVTVGDTIHIGPAEIVIRENSSLKEGEKTLPWEGPPILSEVDNLMIEPPGLRDLFAKAYQFEDRNVLLVGEAGVGKELLARAMHQRSKRAPYPFTMFSCEGLSESDKKSFESELCGYEKGAYPDAVVAKQGILEQVTHGTLFLDYVDRLPPPLQEALHRVLRAKAVRRIDGGTSRPFDVRVISAGRPEVERGLQRELYDKLGQTKLEIPPLRARMGDVEVLAGAFLSEEARKSSGRGAVLTLSKEALDALNEHKWPGNHRELRNVIWRAATAAALSKDGIVRPEHLGLDMNTGVDDRVTAPPPLR